MIDNFFRGKKVCCISDIHIGVHQNSNIWHNINTEWATWLAVELKKRGIEDIQISGDLFHYRDEISVDTLHHAVNILKIWDDFNISILVGNHDAFYKESSEINSLEILARWPNINVFSNVTQLKSHGNTFAQVPWGTKVTDIPVSDVIFGHFEINYFKMTSFQMCDGRTNPKELVKRCNNRVITGHFHLRDEKIYDDKSILYTGSPFHLDLGDEGSTKGFYILDAETLDMEFVENNISPKYEKMKLSWLVEQDGFDDNIKSRISNNFLRFYLDLKIDNNDLTVIQNHIRKYGPMSIDVERDYDNKLTMSDGMADIQSVDKLDIIAEYIGMLTIENPKEITRYLQDLYKKIA